MLFDMSVVLFFLHAFSLYKCKYSMLVSPAHLLYNFVAFNFKTFQIKLEDLSAFLYVCEHKHLCSRYRGAECLYHNVCVFRFKFTNS